MFVLLTITSFFTGLYSYYLGKKIYYWLKPNKDIPEHIITMLIRQYISLDEGNITFTQYDEMVYAIAKYYHFDDVELYNTVMDEYDNMRLRSSDVLFKYV